MAKKPEPAVYLWMNARKRVRGGFTHPKWNGRGWCAPHRFSAFSGTLPARVEPTRRSDLMVIGGGNDAGMWTGYGKAKDYGPRAKRRGAGK